MSCSDTSVVVLGDGVLALGKGVPQLDGAVAGGRHNLAVVSRESNAQHITSVTDEAAGGGTAGKGEEFG